MFDATIVEEVTNTNRDTRVNSCNNGLFMQTICLFQVSTLYCFHAFIRIESLLVLLLATRRRIFVEHKEEYAHYNVIISACS